MLFRSEPQDAGWSSLVARQAHNLKAAGSNPAPATKFFRPAVPYRVYVIRNPRGRFYIGFSENIDIRVQQHNAGMSRSTRGRGPWRIVWESDLLTSSVARELELELKKQKGGNGFYKLTGLQRS